MKVNHKMPISEFTLRAGQLCGEWPMLGAFTCFTIGFFLVPPLILTLIVLIPVWYACLKVKEWRDGEV